ncbi:oxysterol-binding protein-related protein 1 isoform 2-T2 [Odontesthes bonariensis]|uniref:oxysterol-binding protein-related protein 1 isoform X2 n=1 Tax=Odontesthes bonariensis TaxID=219752 RepID=UPI003F582B0C
MEELEPEEQFLRYARNGDLPGVQRLLMAKIREETQININCKGKSKSNLGWTPLHLACYFGHRDVVEELLKAGADVNLPNNIGDTPLHKAAFTGRKEVVMLLLHYDACATVINGTAQIPKDVTQNAEIRSMLEAAERTEERKLEEELLEASREGNLSTLTKLLSRKKPPDINCTDLLGNTPLHCAAYRGQRQCALKLLKSGANPSSKNKNGQTVFDLASDTAMKQFLEANVHRGLTRHVKKYEGLLWKSSRFFGWRSYWVVLQDGVLSWYSKQSDAAANVRRQGCKSLTNAHCLIRNKDNCFFTLKCFDDSVHHFKVSPKTEPEATRKAWLDALEEHSAYSTHYCSQEQGSEEEEEDEVMSLGELTESLQAAEVSQKKLEKEVAAFLSMLKNDGLSERFPLAILQKMQEISELSSETTSTLSVCLSLFSRQEGVRSVKLEQEVEKNKILSEALQTLATEHHELEQSVVKGSSPRSALSEDEFHDAVSESGSEVSLSGFETVASHSFEEDEEEDEGSVMLSSPCSSPTTSMLQEDHHGDRDETQPNGITKHRTSLPAPMFSRNDFSIWSILRNCIGMELSKITMPVIFNEPLSFLQRLTEYMEHTYLIHQANASSDSIERMKCVAAFAVSAVASQWERTGKPFNPLLGETYELVREDLGFRLISEQVSHHPPVSAFHAEGLKEDFVFHGSIYPKLKFWGKSVEAEPKGVITLELPKHNEAYTWTNPTCCVHNIIVGQLWIEQYGNVEVINHRTGEKCCLNFKPCGLFGKELHKVEGYILDKSKKKLCALYGKWTECLHVVDPAGFEAHKKNDKKGAEQKKASKAGCSVDQEEVPSQSADTVEVIPGSQLLWRIAPRPANSTQMYSFTSFAMQLNELRKEMEGVIPQTDCRLRPDIRAMENGDIDLASEEKKRLEEKQRAARKNRSKSDEEWKTKWFQQGQNPHTRSQDWLLSGGYWGRTYSQLPDIY